MRFVFIFLTILMAAPLWAQTRTFEIIDRQGFGEEIVAATLEIPKDWSASGEVLWIKPCSGNELYELTLTVSSPDGLTGARILPGHQIIWSHYEMTGDPGMAQMWQAQQEAERNKMRAQFEGSNCHLAPLRDVEALFRTLILSKRGPDTRVAAKTPNQQVLSNYKQIFAQPAPGSQVLYDANLHELKYARGGRQMTERVNFSWYMFQSETRDPGFYMFSQHTTVESIQIDWFPDARAHTDIAILDKIGQSMQFKPDWQKRVNDVREEIARKRRQTNDENARDRKRQLQERDRLSDKRHQDFLRQIWQ